MGNVNAQSAAIGKLPVDTVSCVEKHTPDIEELLNEKPKIFVASGTVISNQEQVINAEFVVISNNVEKTETIKSDQVKTAVRTKNIISKKEKKTQEYQVIENKILFDVSKENSDNFFSEKASFKNLVLPQNTLGKQKVILIKQLSSLISFVSECYIDPVFTIQVPENLYSETSFIRPPPIS